MARPVCDLCLRTAWAVRKTQFTNQTFFCRYHTWRESGYLTIPPREEQEQSEDLWLPLAPLTRRQRFQDWWEKTWDEEGIAVSTTLLGVVTMIWSYVCFRLGAGPIPLIAGYLLGSIVGRVLFKWWRGTHGD